MKKKVSWTREEIVKEVMKLNPGISKGDLGFRADGRLEWFCKHGTGHTIFAPKGSDFVHGCCFNDVIGKGCCSHLKEFNPFKV